MSFHHGIPSELFMGILQHASVTDLKNCALVNSFFQNLAQSALFSVVFMSGNVDERLRFFEAGRGGELIKHTQSLVLGEDFCLHQDQSRVSSFIRAVGQPRVLAFRFSYYTEWNSIPHQIVTELYTFVMPHLHTLMFYCLFEIPFIEVLSHCTLL